nr:MAG TPA: hypothetical protein [Caudoviricetes sp.]
MKLTILVVPLEMLAHFCLYLATASSGTKIFKSFG